MSDVINQAVEALNAKLGGGGFDGSVKVEITGEGSLVVDSDGARAGDEETDCTLTADAETFVGMMDGDVNPTSAFMTGKLAVDGDMGVAMKLGTLLA
ncbi:SCP2 sterol-binding domain-containing protein [Neptunicoccus cionae]|uniref:SCP2 sterol-binding domain-containing protein n=1 Tax=Neptunicoccus cionae TaxID=2035344 RepID=UPI000C75E69A|nr:SCP2 sterol-binding domain-containing protein [Amylibacter cionae]MBR9863369.1 SCP2 sterol-binding domain-containing protein [Paracoccaceae bacterium]PLS22450.1 sterol carrier family protein [Amylibacter cionae]